jgi:hypothetical protein
MRHDPPGTGRSADGSMTSRGSEEPLSTRCRRAARDQSGLLVEVRERQLFDRALQAERSDAQIYLRVRNRRVAEECLHDTKIGALFQDSGCERVTQTGVGCKPDAGLEAQDRLWQLSLQSEQFVRAAH